MKFSKVLGYALLRTVAFVCWALFGNLLLAETTDPSAGKEKHAESCESFFPAGSEEIVILIYPGFTAMDALGPEYFLSCLTGAKVRLIAKTATPVRSESGIYITPHLTFKDLPKNVDLFLVPGGASGTLAALQDPETIDFIRSAGKASKITGSICTGSLLLGAAGLLEGYEATSHWQTVKLLPLCGAVPSSRRVVFDRDRTTAAGVTAGLDLALEIVRKYRGDQYARGVQLLAEYDPQPLFPGGGNPSTADPEITGVLNEMHRPFIDQFDSALRSARSDAAKRP